MSLAILNYILARVQFQDWTFVTDHMGGGFSLQVQFFAADNAWVGGELLPQRGRKWYVSSHATEGEAVQTALKAILTAMEHEVREQFLVDGVAIFGPHLDIQTLVQIAQKQQFREKVSA